MSTTESSESFQITIDAAEAYEAAFVPAFFAQWAPLLCETARVRDGQRILDVACGTGIVARVAADRVGAPNVVGLDLNDAMLTVARRSRPDIDWRLGDAAALPMRDGEFDTVLCQMALMFFPDRAQCVREMARVAAAGGTVAVLVPSGLDVQPAYGPLVDAATRHAGPEARALLSTYFACGELDELTDLFRRVGLVVDRSFIHTGTSRFPSIDALVATEVESTPLGERISPEVYERIRGDARIALAPFTTAGGGLEAPFKVHVVTGRQP